MDEKKLGKLRAEAIRLRRVPFKADAVESLAAALGRTRANRGKHPMWVSAFPGLFPLSIPAHGNKDIAIGTRRSILNQLEEDIAAWEEKLFGGEEDDDGSNHD